MDAGRMMANRREVPVYNFYVVPSKNLRKVVDLRICPSSNFLMEAGMTRETRRAPLALGTEQRAMLEELAGSRTSQLRAVERAKAVLR